MLIASENYEQYAIVVICISHYIVGQWHIHGNFTGDSYNIISDEKSGPKLLENKWKYVKKGREYSDDTLTVTGEYIPNR